MRTLFAALLLATPATAADPPVVMTTQYAPLDALLADARAVVRLVAGDQPVETMDAAIKQKLGEKMFAGIDTTKPFGQYMYLPAPPAGKRLDKLTEAETAGLMRQVYLVPVTKADEFRDLVARLLADTPTKLTPVDGNDGLYQMDLGPFGGPFPIRVRIAGGYAHVGVGLTEGQMAEKALYPADKVIDPKDAGKVVTRYHLDRVPAAYPKELLDLIDKGVGDLADRAGITPSFAEAGAIDALKLLRSYAAALAADGQTLTQRVLLDAKTGELAIEMAVGGKPGSKLTTAFAGRKPTTNKFAGLVTDSAAAGLVTRLPLFDADLREIVGQLLDGGAKAVAMDAAGLPKPVLDALAAGLVRTVKTGEFDLAVAANGPDKDGKFTAVVAVAFENPSELEKALRDAIKSAPKEAQDAIAFDAEKAGDVGIHEITPPVDLPPPVRAVLGGSTVYLAFGPKGIYAAAGPDAVPAIKAAISARPAAAKVFDLTANPKRLGRLVAAADRDAGQTFETAFGTADKTQPVLSLDVAGGERLTVRLTTNVKLIGSAVTGLGRKANAQFQAVPAPVPPRKKD